MSRVGREKSNGEETEVNLYLLGFGVEAGKNGEFGAG